MSNRISMTGSAVLGALLIGAALPPAYAQETAGSAAGPSKQSGLGGLAGLAVGAAAAGPIGAVVGLTIGVVAGDRYHRQLQSAAATRANLDESEAQRAQLTQSVSRLDDS